MLSDQHPSISATRNRSIKLKSAVPTTLPSTLAKGAVSLNATVTFAPADGSPACTVLSVATNDEDNPVLRALFTGTGDAPRLCTSTPLIDFGSIVVGSTVTDSIELSSCGTKPVTITGLALNERFPPFALGELSFPITLEPEETLSIPAEFTPQVVAPFTQEAGSQGVVLVQTENAEQSYQIGLVGIGTAEPVCAISVIPALINFGSVPFNTTESQPLIVRNTGLEDCVVTDIAVRGSADPFSIVVTDYTPGEVMVPGEFATVEVSFHGPNLTSVSSGFIDVTSDDPVNPLIAVPLEGRVPGDEGCQLDVNPPSVNFGVVPPNVLRSKSVTVTNVGTEPCFLTGADLSANADPGFVNSAPGFGFLIDGASREMSVSFRGQLAQGAANAVLTITSTSAPDLDVPVSAFNGPAAICVEPRQVAFGDVTVPTQQSFTITACGSIAVTIEDLPFLTQDLEFTLVNPPSLPFTLQPGGQQNVTVNYDPSDEAPDYAVVAVQSDDLAFPEIKVEITGGHEIVPAESGRYLYFWQIPSIIGGDVVRLPLQGNIDAAPYFGPRTGQGCAGCHQISPDGAYLAVVEVGRVRFVDTDTDLELFLGYDFIDPTFFSWRSDPNAGRGYEFAYGDGSDIQTASLFDGAIGPLQGANDPVLIESMPTWGPNGQIAFAQGEATQQTENGGNFGLAGSADILVVDQNGGNAAYLDGASQNGMANYYPTWSPNGMWIAFTQSASANGTIAADDAQIRLVRADNSGEVLTLGALNGMDGANSYPTWSVDGRYLSFSSDRSGGAGDWDIYIAEIDPVTGADQPAINLNDFGLGQLNTPDFEHASQWSP